MKKSYISINLFFPSVANAAIEVRVCVWVPCCCVSVTLSVSAGG